MDDFSELKPGKLKRKSKRSSGQSIVEMPVLQGEASPTGKLLGQSLGPIEDEAASADWHNYGNSGEYALWQKATEEDERLPKLGADAEASRPSFASLIAEIAKVDKGGVEENKDAAEGAEALASPSILGLTTLSQATASAAGQATASHLNHGQPQRSERVQHSSAYDWARASRNEEASARRLSPSPKAAEETPLEDDELESEARQDIDPLDEVFAEARQLSERATVTAPKRLRKLLPQKQEAESKLKLHPSGLRLPADKPNAAPETNDALRQALKRLEQENQKMSDALARFQHLSLQSERRHFWHYVIANIFFCAVMGIILYFVFFYKNQAKMTSLQYKHELYQNAVNSQKVLQAEFERAQRGATAALEIFQLSEEGRYEDALQRYTELRGELTHPAESALLEHRIEALRWRLADNAYRDGLVLYNAGNLEQARDAFFKSLNYKENTAYSPLLSFYLAQSLFQLGDFEGARRYYERAQEGDLNYEMDATARFNRGAAAEKLGDDAYAYEQYDYFTRRFRQHRLAEEAAKRKARVERSKNSKGSGTSESHR